MISADVLKHQLISSLRFLGCWMNNHFVTSSAFWRRLPRKNTRFAKQRFVAVGSRELVTVRLEDLSLIPLKVECPVVAVEEESRPMRLLPSRVRPSIVSSANLPSYPRWIQKI